MHSDEVLDDVTGAGVAASRESMTSTIDEPDTKSAKWFGWWVFRRCAPADLRLIVAGIHRADGASAQSKNVKQMIDLPSLTRSSIAT